MKLKIEKVEKIEQPDERIIRTIDQKGQKHDLKIELKKDEDNETFLIFSQSSGVALYLCEIEVMLDILKKRKGAK